MHFKISAALFPDQLLLVLYVAQLGPGLGLAVGLGNVADPPPSFFAELLLERAQNFCCAVWQIFSVDLCLGAVHEAVGVGTREPMLPTM